MKDEQEEKLSPAKFIFLEGILKSGVLYACGMTIGYYLIDYDFTFAHLREYIFSNKTIFIFLFNAIVFGLLAGFAQIKQKNNTSHK